MAYSVLVVRGFYVPTLSRIELRVSGKLFVIHPDTRSFEMFGAFRKAREWGWEIAHCVGCALRRMP